jgi:hypothetical protein
MKTRSPFWWLFAVSFSSAGVGLVGLLLAMSVLSQFAFLRWIFGPLWLVGAPLSLAVTIAWLFVRLRTMLRARSAERATFAPLPARARPRSSFGALTPLQIGGGVGAAATCLLLLVLRDVSSPVRQPGVPGTPDFLLGVWSAVRGLVGMALGAAFDAIRRRRLKHQGDRINDRPS